MCSFQDTGDAEFIEELSSVLGDEVKQIDTIIVVFKYKVINMTMVMSLCFKYFFSALFLQGTMPNGQANGKLANNQPS